MVIGGKTAQEILDEKQQQLEFLRGNKINRRGRHRLKSVHTDTRVLGEDSNRRFRSLEDIANDDDNQPLHDWPSTPQPWTPGLSGFYDPTPRPKVRAGLSDPKFIGLSVSDASFVTDAKVLQNVEKVERARLVVDPEKGTLNADQHWVGAVSVGQGAAPGAGAFRSGIAPGNQIQDAEADMEHFSKSAQVMDLTKGPGVGAEWSTLHRPLLPVQPVRPSPPPKVGAARRVGGERDEERVSKWAGAKNKARTGELKSVVGFGGGHVVGAELGGWGGPVAVPKASAGLYTDVCGYTPKLDGGHAPRLR